MQFHTNISNFLFHLFVWIWDGFSYKPVEVSAAVDADAGFATDFATSLEDKIKTIKCEDSPSSRIFVFNKI